jgi:hypothetical protein
MECPPQSHLFNIWSLEGGAILGYSESLVGGAKFREVGS